MAVPKMHISVEKLRQKMAQYQEVTGKTIASTMRRAARQLCVNLCYNTPPFGMGSEAKKEGEQATTNDILKVFLSLAPLPQSVGASTKGLRGMAERLQNKSLGEALVAAIDHATVPGRGKNKKAHRAKGVEDLRAILANSGRWASFNLEQTPSHSVHKAARNSFGRVKSRSKTIISDTGSLVSYITEQKKNVGLTKAAWAAAAIKVEADVKDSLSGIPAWVKRHVDRAGATVTDKCETKNPVMILTSRIPWADKALRGSGFSEAVRIAQDKFYRSMNKEIRFALKEVKS